VVVSSQKKNENKNYFTISFIREEGTGNNNQPKQ
jgi:hypothetical protein